MRKLIRLAGVTKFYGKQPVLKNLSLELEAGRFYALLGRNGTGKSTLMRLLMRLEAADQGEGEILGVPLQVDSAELNGQIGYVSESIDYAIPLPMKRVFRTHAELYPAWNQPLLQKLTDQLGIDLSKQFSELSRGQKMQVAFAAAYAIQPRLLLLDEVTSVLDARAHGILLDLSRQFTTGGGTIVLATNILSEVKELASDYLLLQDGSVRPASLEDALQAFNDRKVA